MEIKWLMIAWAVIMTAMFIGMGVEADAHSKCRQAYAQSAKHTVEDIQKICGK